MTWLATMKTHLKGLAVVLLGSVMCISLSGCLLAAAGAGAAGGYILGKESEEDEREVHIHEHHSEPPPPPVDRD